MSTDIIEKWLARPLKPMSVADVPELAAALGTTVGEVRPDNQDRAIVARFTSRVRPRNSFVCFAVCDGMGGMVDGARCAQIALSFLLFKLTQTSAAKDASGAIRAAVLGANAEVHRQYRERGGTTLVAAVIFPDSAAAVSVGDSRIYAIDQRKDLKQVSIDDTIAGELSKVAELRSSPSRWNTFATQLAQFVGIGEAIEPRIYSISNDVMYLLTTDGVHSLSHDTMRGIVASGAIPQTIVPRLLQVSRWCGGADNATAICVPMRQQSWAAPEWSTGDWLEIWDSAGKLELPIEQSLPKAVSPAPYAGTKPAPPIKAKRPKKTSGNAKKEKRSFQKPGSSAQQSLKIEIVDEKLTDEKSGGLEASRTQAEKVQEDKSGKRD